MCRSSLYQNTQISSFVLLQQFMIETCRCLLTSKDPLHDASTLTSHNDMPGSYDTPNIGQSPLAFPLRHIFERRVKIDVPEIVKCSKRGDSRVQEKKLTFATDLCRTDCENVACEIASDSSTLDSSTVTTERGLIWPTNSRDLLETGSVEISNFPQHVALSDSTLCPSVAVHGAAKMLMTRESFFPGQVVEERTRMFSQTELNREQPSLQRLSQPFSHTNKDFLSNQADGEPSETSFALTRENSREGSSEISSVLTFNPKGYSDPRHETKFAFLRDKVINVYIYT